MEQYGKSGYCIESYFSSVADSAPVPVKAGDRSFSFFNRAWLSFTGRNHEQECGDGWTNGIHPEDMNHYLHQYQSCFEKREVFSFEYRLKRASGEYCWILDQGTPYYKPDGTFSGYIIYGLDIHDKKEMMQHIAWLQRSNDELEQFAYAASHDIKEPIRKIKFFASSLVAYPDKQELFLNKIQESATRIALLVDNLLEFSRLQYQGVSLEPTDLNEVINDVKKDLELVIEEQGAIIHCDLLPVIPAIPGQLNRLFFNLLSNATKYVCEGTSPEIHISTRNATNEDIRGWEMDGSQKYIVIIVTDNGIGFPETDAEKIFTIFHRLHSGAAFPGTGIGLAICKKVVDNHKGIVYAGSSPGKGAVFTIILPR